MGGRKNHVKEKNPKKVGKVVKIGGLVFTLDTAPEHVWI